MSTLPQFASRRKTKRLLYSPATVIVLAVVFVFLAHAAWGMYGKYRLSADKLGQAEGQFADMQGQEESLSDSIAQLSTPAGVDQELQTNFRIVKPGQSLAVIVSAAATSGPATTTPGLWARIGAWFSRSF